MRLPITVIFLRVAREPTCNNQWGS